MLFFQEPLLSLSEDTFLVRKLSSLLRGGAERTKWQKRARGGGSGTLPGSGGMQHNPGFQKAHSRLGLLRGQEDEVWKLLLGNSLSHKSNTVKNPFCG